MCHWWLLQAKAVKNATRASPAFLCTHALRGIIQGKPLEFDEPSLIPADLMSRAEAIGTKPWKHKLKQIFLSISWLGIFCCHVLPTDGFCWSLRWSLMRFYACFQTELGVSDLYPYSSSKWWVKHAASVLPSLCPLWDVYVELERWTYVWEWQHADSSVPVTLLRKGRAAKKILSFVGFGLGFFFFFFMSIFN